jgi:hypothetical protein
MPLWLNDLGLPESKQPFKGALSTLSSANQGVAILSLLGAEAENRNMYIFSSVWVWEQGFHTLHPSWDETCTSNIDNGIHIFDLLRAILIIIIQDIPR